MYFWGKVSGSRKSIFHLHKILLKSISKIQDTILKIVSCTTLPLYVDTNLEGRGYTISALF